MIEVPSGLIDEGESPVQSAVRELKEETGYVGVPAEGAEESVVMFNGMHPPSRETRLIHRHHYLSIRSMLLF